MLILILTLCDSQVQGQERQNVRMAAQLLSESCGRALQKYLPQYSSQASFIINMDRAFDVLNSRIIHDVKDERCPYGLKLQKQEEALKFLTTYFRLSRFLGHKQLLPCQKALIVAGHEMPKLFNFLQNKYNISFILTSRLNLDALEIFFSCVRRIGANVHPDCSDFEARIRILLLGLDVPTTLFQSTSVQVVDEADDNMGYCTAHKIGFQLSDCQVNDNDYNEVQLIMSETVINNQTCTNGEESIDAQQEALKYVAGFIALKLKETHPHFLGEPSASSWISEISKGNLIHPSPQLLDLIKEFELVFCLFHGKSLDVNPGVIQRFFDLLKSKYPNSDERFLKLYTRTRTFIRLKYLKKEYANKQSNFRNYKKNKQWVASKLFK